MEVPYTYRAQVLRVIDGDTVVIRVDVGFRMWAEMPMRLAFINAPEINTEAGKTARIMLESLLDTNHPIVVKTYKPIDKYGRYLGTIYVGEIDANQWMIDNGFATRYQE